MDFTRMRKFQDYLTGWRIPGNDCSVMLNGEEVYRYQSGYADVENNIKMKGDELYFCWSVSKLITTSLALRLHEAGLFTMNDFLADYIPEFDRMTVRKVIDGKEEIVEAKNKIKIKHLFNMTAGFDYNFNSATLKELREKTDNKCTTLEAVKAMAKAPLLFEPGVGWCYSLCHDVLGAFIEVVSGKKLRDYAMEELFLPLGMSDTTYNVPSKEKMQRMAVQYEFNNETQKYAPMGNVCNHIIGENYDSGGAGVVSSCSDYMKFASCIANGGTAKNGYRYLSRPSINLWRTNTLDENQLANGFCWPYLGGYGYGYGVRTMMRPEVSGALSPVGEFGWGGAAGAWVILDPDNNLALVYMQHMLVNQEPFISPRIRNILYSCI